MDFAALKKKALEFKDKTLEFSKKTIEETAVKVSKSSLVIKNNDELEAIILKSQNTTFVSQEWVSKVFTKRSILIVGDWEKEFFKQMLINLPILLTKAFSQDIALKLMDVKNKKIDISRYNLLEIPALIVFENKEVYKIIYSEENLKKVVKNLTLDINKSIEEL